MSNYSLRYIRCLKPFLKNILIHNSRISCRFITMHDSSGKKLIRPDVETPDDASSSEASSSSSDSEKENNNKIEKLAISYSACGFLGSYHFGVMLSFFKNGQTLLSRVDRLAGASAGSLVAALMIFAPDKLQDALNILYELARELHTLRYGAMSPGFYLAHRLTHVVEPFIPEDISKAQNRLFISLTHRENYYGSISSLGYGRDLSETNRIVSTYPSREYLINCLMASCYIPVYSGGVNNEYPSPEIDGKTYIDGGFTNNLPTFDDVKTLTISPFSGSADISPRDVPIHKMFEWKINVGRQTMKVMFDIPNLNVNMQNLIRGAQSLFPPNIETLHKYCELGYRDGMSYLLRNGYLEREKGTEV